MSDNSSIEEQYQIAKSSMTSYVASSLCFEYVLAQNKNKNEKGFKFLLQLEEIARETINVFGLPTTAEDIEQLNRDFTQRIISSIRCGLLET